MTGVGPLNGMHKIERVVMCCNTKQYCVFAKQHLDDIDREIARQAARLQAEYQIRPPDALQISACLVHGAQNFITNDRKPGRLSRY